MIRRARIAPVSLKRKNLWPGLGVLNYYDLLAQANLQNCAPMDSTCVSNNVAKEAAVEDLWVSKYQQTGAPDGTRLSFTPQTAAQVKEFYNPQDIFNGGNVVDTRGVLQVTGTYQGNDPLPPVMKTPPVACGNPPTVTYRSVGGMQIPNPDSVLAFARWTQCATGKAPTVPAAKSPVTPQGDKIINSSGAQQNVPPSMSTGCFKLFGNMESCIGPVGALTLYLGIGAGLLFYFGGGRGR